MDFKKCCNTKVLRKHLIQYSCNTSFQSTNYQPIMGSNKNDFVLNSKGRCFFCVDQISAVKYEQGHEIEEPPLLSKHSIHYVSRYLKMDMRKVFKDTEQIPSHLLTKVENSRLKVELCDECVRLTEQFSENYRKLEKAEMELASCLKLIHAKFLNPSETDKTHEFKTLTNVEPHLQLSTDGELEILEVLRKEAFQKAQQKLRAGVPRVNFRKLTRKEIRAERLKFRPKINIVNKQNSPVLASNVGGSSKSTSELEGNDSEIKLEIQDNLVDDGNYSFDDNLNANDEDMCEDSEDMELIVERNEVVNNSRHELSVLPNLVEEIHRKPETHLDAEKPMWSINPTTRKYKCHICSMEYSDKPSVQRHYKSVHLKVRFKCVTCGKQFSQLSACNRHQKSAHVGVRYACQICGKPFTYTFNVREHQRTTECGKKLDLELTPPNP